MAGSNKNWLTLAEAVSFIAWGISFTEADFSAANGLAATGSLVKKTRGKKPRNKKRNPQETAIINKAVAHGKRIREQIERLTGESYPDPNDGTFPELERAFSAILAECKDDAISAEGKAGEWSSQLTPISRKWFHRAPPPTMILEMGILLDNGNGQDTWRWCDVAFDQNDIEKLRKKLGETNSASAAKVNKPEKKKGTPKPETISRRKRAYELVQEQIATQVGDPPRNKPYMGKAYVDAARYAPSEESWTANSIKRERNRYIAFLKRAKGQKSE